MPEDEFADSEVRSTHLKRKFPEAEQSRPDGAASRPTLVKGPVKGKGYGKNKGAKSNGKTKDAKSKKEISWAFNEGQCAGKIARMAVTMSAGTAASITSQRTVSRKLRALWEHRAHPKQRKQMACFVR